MSAALDLTEAQTSRVIEQAVRTGTMLDIDVRPWSENMSPLKGRISSRERTLLRVVLSDPPPDGIDGLVGAFCDVQIQLSGELYQFSTCVLDVIVSQRTELVMATPQAVQVLNRRRFVRKTPHDPITIQLFPADATESFQTSLSDICLTGLSVRGHRCDLDDVLLVGDEVRATVEIPELGESFDLPVVICAKTLESDRTNMIVGLEFVETQASDEELALLTRLRALLNDPSLGFMETDGVE